jgi:hypothetical protein
MAFQPSYESVSPFGATDIIGRFMVYYTHRVVPPNILDTIIVLDQQYARRPDLLAADLYGDPDLFWIVAIRNGLQDPVFDFRAGELYTIPHPSFVRNII